MKLKLPQKNPPKQGRILEGRGGIFLAGQNFPPELSLKLSAYIEKLYHLPSVPSPSKMRAYLIN